jgi:glutamyl-Q tRNA(Asp) synthetase
VWIVKQRRKSKKDNLLNSLKLNPYRGRFAPSPSGSLHFGSLLAATASYLDAKAHQGDWLLRIEDLDAPRIQKGAISTILNSLECYGFEWDEEVLYQSQRLSAYQAITDQLLKRKKAYFCACSRKVLQQNSPVSQYGFIYTGTCRQGIHSSNSSHLRSVRVLSNSTPMIFKDRLYGACEQNIAQAIGDFVIKRSDGVFAYQLAVVIDDHYQGITDVVRGYDLLDNTARQLYLQRLFNFHQPRYLHIPIAIDTQGNKLSKRNRAKALICQYAFDNIYQVLVFLGQNPPPKHNFSQLDDLWQWAIMHWNINTLPQQGSLTV